jgi:hypothetical protein
MPVSKSQVESVVEIRVERKFDALDRIYLNGEISRDEYEKQVAAINRWAATEIRRLMEKTP